MRKSIIGATCTCLAVVSFNANAALIERFDGQAYYDDVLNITWMPSRIANGNSYAIETHQEALTIASSYVFEGFDNWRLPNLDVNGDGLTTQCALNQVCLDNEFRHLYGFNNITMKNTPNIFFSVPFTLKQFWASGFEGGGFDFSDGTSYTGGSGKNVMVVHDGDIGAVPIPSAIWLFGSGLLGLIGVARRRGNA